LRRGRGVRGFPGGDICKKSCESLRSFGGRDAGKEKKRLPMRGGGKNILEKGALPCLSAKMKNAPGGGKGIFLGGKCSFTKRVTV